MRIIRVVYSSTMHIVINKKNTQQYLSALFPLVTSIKISKLINNQKISINFFNHFPNLVKLDISECRLKGLWFLKGCPNLIELNCSGNTFESLKGIHFCPSLEVLHCSNTGITSIKALRKCRTITEFDCSYNQLLNLHGIEALIGLEIANIAHNNLSTLECLALCTKLRILDCTYNRIYSLEPLRHFRSLTHLTCEYTFIQNLDGINKCPLLASIRCSNNDWLYNIKATCLCLELRTFECNWVGRRVGGLQIMCDFNLCSQLQTLELRSNHLAVLPNLRSNSKLRHLRISSNRLGVLPNLSFNPCLTTLEARSNHLTSFRGLGYCPNLIKVDLSHNRITSTQGIGLLPNLRILFMAKNRLANLADLRLCSKLIALYLGENNLGSIDELALLPELVHLDLTHNYVRSLKPLAHAPNLSSLIIAGNICDLGSTEAWQYVSFMMKQHGRVPTIYGEKANIYDTCVHKSVIASVETLLQSTSAPCTSTDFKPYLNDDVVSILLKFCEDPTLHPDLNLTYHQLLTLVWTRAQSLKCFKPFCLVFSKQIPEMDNLCFMTRFNRTVRVLSTFCKDIVLAVPLVEHITTVCASTASALNPYDPLVHYEQTQKLLAAEGIDHRVIELWLDPIRDLIET